MRIHTRLALLVITSAAMVGCGLVPLPSGSADREGPGGVSIGEDYPSGTSAGSPMTADAGSWSDDDTSGTSSDWGDDTGGSDPTDTGTSGASPDPNPIGAGQLTAAEWRDLDNWMFWRSLFDDAQWTSMEELWGFDTARRLSVAVTSAGEPVVDAVVTLSRAGSQDAIFTARSDNQGRAELFADLFDTAAETDESYTVTVQSGESVATIDDAEILVDEEVQPLAVELEDFAPTAQVLDLMFVIDTTGSMGDELEFLKTELLDVIDQVREEQGADLEVRTSVNFYRDSGDDYTVRSFPFTTPEEASGQLAQQSAGGGGDFPEAVEEGLADGIDDHEWSESARARLLFLVLDAPPHQTSSIIQSLHESTATSAATGVRIIPLTGSGIDKQTEFLTRFLAISTGGTYVFLTDDSGIGGEHIESHVEGPQQTIGDVEIQPLNTLLAAVINGFVQ